MIIKREIQDKIKASAKQFRVLTLLGPRQSGKTTLVKSAFSSHEYLNLEDPETRSLAQEDPKTFFRRHSGNIILDEVQRVPELLSHIQVLADESPELKGRFILTGSHQPLLKEKISQSLAGRTTLYTLLPLSISEIKSVKEWSSNTDPEHWIFRGCMPEIFESNTDPRETYRSYFRTYVERDVRQILQVKDQALFEKFVKLCAARVGQLLNKDSLASDVGVSPKTIEEWVSILEASFVIFRLQPYFENFGKRQIKSPKLYFYEPGLATYLLGVENQKQLETHSAFGSLFENLVAVEFLKQRLNRGEDPNIYFFRDSNGNEVDIILAKANSLFPFEVKSASTFNQSMLKNLKSFSNTSGNLEQSSAVIFTGKSGEISKESRTINFLEISEIIEF